MQSHVIKYLKLKNQDTLLVYWERQVLFFKIGTQSGWSHPQILAENVNPSFSLSHYQEEIFLLYSTRLGELYLLRTTDFSHWDRKQISIEKRDLSQTKFFMIPDQSSLHLLYHLPTEMTGVHALIYTVFHHGTWEKPYQIDRFLPFGQTPFLAGQKSPNHIVLYYRTARNVIISREMLLSPSSIGGMTPLIQTPYPCADVSIIQDTERIHMLYIVKSLFRSQVIYQYKQAASISAPRVLWESGGSCEQCLIFQQDHKLHTMWIANGQPYCCQSTDNGNTFSPIERYTALFPYHCIKGEFLLSSPNGTLNASEAFGDGQNGYQMAIFSPATPAISLLTNDVIGVQAASKEGFTEENNVTFPATPLSKSQQIEELTKLLVRRGEEIANLNIRWKERHQQSETERNALSLQLSALELENQALREKIFSLEQEKASLQTETPLTQSIEEPTTETTTTELSLAEESPATEETLLEESPTEEISFEEVHTEETPSEISPLPSFETPSQSLFPEESSETNTLNPS